MEADTGPIGGDLSHEFVILAETGESKIYSDKRIFDIDISKHNGEDDSINELRKKYDEFYAVTDDKFKKEDFEKKVTKENQLVT
jgi:prolyl-tRNA synthetase